MSIFLRNILISQFCFEQILLSPIIMLIVNKLKWYLLNFISVYKLLPGKVKTYSNMVLLALMVMAVYSHYMVHDKFERIAPALVSIIRLLALLKFIVASFCELILPYLYINGFQVFLFMLIGRLVIDWQERRAEARLVTANGVDDKVKKQDWAGLWLKIMLLSAPY